MLVFHVRAFSTPILFSALFMLLSVLIFIGGDVPAIRDGTGNLAAISSVTL